MRAIDRTTALFVRSVKEALPDVDVRVQKSRAKHGASNYVYIDLKPRPLKVRISDHPVGMQRAQYGGEALFLHHLAKPASWAVWVSELPARAQPLRRRNESVRS
jgi:hypothetical protein